MKVPKILWTQPTQSGLCDRLSDLFFIYAFAHIYDAELHLEWPRFEIKDIDAPHRSVDILLDNILQYVVFPSKIHFNSDVTQHKENADMIFNAYVGGGKDANSFYSAYISNVCSFKQFEDAIQKIKHEFTFCPEILNHADNLPQEFIVLHIRRGDKVRQGNWNDGYFINMHELEYLDLITKKAIDSYADLGYKHLFVCGDEDSKNKPFIDYAESKNFNVFVTPQKEKWIQTYYDIAIMSRAKCVITSQRYSSFAKFPTLIGRGIFQTVYQIEENRIS